MFIRYSLTTSAEEVSARFGVDVPEGYRPHYNAAPTQLLPVITQESQRGLSFFYWGTPPIWANQKPLGEKIINTRAELISEKTVLKKKLREQRCLIPADGFYGWKRAGKKASIPYRFTLADKDQFSIAGLWEEYDDEKGERFHTFMAITRPSVNSVAPISERMPVILEPGKEQLWLTLSDADELLAHLNAYSPVMSFYSVSPRVNLTDRDDRQVILPAPPADQFGNLTLFD